MYDNSLLGLGQEGVGSYDYQVFVQQIQAGNTDIPQEIREAVLAKKLKIRPLIGFKAIISGISPLVSFFTNAEKRVVGISNIENSKPRIGELFMISAIQLKSGTAVSADEIGLRETVFAGIEATPAHKVYVNGWSKFQVANDAIFEELPNESFINTGDNNEKTGLYRLPKPVFVNNAQELQFDLTASSIAGLTANAALKLLLYGIKVSAN